MYKWTGQYRKQQLSGTNVLNQLEIETFNTGVNGSTRSVHWSTFDSIDRCTTLPPGLNKRSVRCSSSCNRNPLVAVDGTSTTWGWETSHSIQKQFQSPFPPFIPFHIMYLCILSHWFHATTTPSNNNCSVHMEGGFGSIAACATRATRLVDVWYRAISVRFRAWLLVASPWLIVLAATCVCVCALAHVPTSDGYYVNFVIWYLISATSFLYKRMTPRNVRTQARGVMIIVSFTWHDVYFARVCEGGGCFFVILFHLCISIQFDLALYDDWLR